MVTTWIRVNGAGKLGPVVRRVAKSREERGVEEKKRKEKSGEVEKSVLFVAKLGSLVRIVLEDDPASPAARYRLWITATKQTGRWCVEGGEEEERSKKR